MGYRYCIDCGDVEKAEQHETPAECAERRGEEECPDPDAHHVPTLIDSDDEFSGA